MVGIGEAAYTPAGAAVITAAFPKEVRARVQGSFDIGMFIGGATGISLGGYIASQFGWRSAFFMVGIPGVILGLAALRSAGVGSQRGERIDERARVVARAGFPGPAGQRILLQFCRIFLCGLGSGLGPGKRISARRKPAWLLV